MQQPRHARPWRRRGLRGAARGAVLGVLAVPSALGLTGLVSLGPALVHRAPPSPRPPLTGRPVIPAPTASSGPSASADALPDPRAQARPAARSAVRSGRPPTPTPSVDAGRTPVAVHAVVGLGDSVPAGSACGCDAYVALLARAAGQAQRSTVRSTNLAVPGATSADVVDQLSDAGTRAALAGADVVVVTIGANDLEGGDDPTSCPSAGTGNSDAVVASCYADALSALSTHLDQLLGRLASVATAPGARVLVTGYWNVFLDGSMARAKGGTYVALADAATRAVNERIAAAAAAHGDTYVDLFTPFRGSDGSRDCTELLAPDGDHPDADGHALIASTLMAALNRAT